MKERNGEAQRAGIRLERNVALNMKMIRERDHPNWSLRQVAAQVQAQGVKLDHGAIRRIEAGERSVRLDEAVAIARALNVSFDALVTDPVLARRQEVVDLLQRLDEVYEKYEAAYVALESAELALGHAMRDFPDVESARRAVAQWMRTYGHNPDRWHADDWTERFLSGYTLAAEHLFAHLKQYVIGGQRLAVDSAEDGAMRERWTAYLAHDDEARRRARHSASGGA
ncbi:helix-turn-helix transcriptional regulator [Demequina sp. SYSU T00192]|uniref:Helix-turn-helix transcriptional regulator n=1 Tax=Demequina litoralis TaxID=3051660 RepID=A0ABT8G668_9MICO|nr:helix-turn-helix transcriptional regulator [Demequina sp. SYSU T00192]MDN4474633.1 helix-turn-helix transcriptional regulator [Demequina sp. SYSU T00192]